MSIDTAASEPVARPRVEGEREQEILDAALDTLSDVGYDRMTMDAVAAKAHASKATLYRRWSTKADLVIDALCSAKEDHSPVDTGNLRDDLISTFCGDADCGPSRPGGGDDGGENAVGGLADERMIRIMASVITAVGREQDFAEKFRTRFVAPKVAMSAAVFARAQERGEIRADLDVDLIAPTLPGIVLHRAILLGQPPDRAFILRVIDDVVLPAARHRPPEPPAST